MNCSNAPVFNVFTNNTDDHEKNFSFLMSPEGQWHLAPAYDMTFIIATNGIEPEMTHCMSIGGKYADITAEDLIRLGRDNSVKNIELISKRLQELRPEG